MSGEMSRIQEASCKDTDLRAVVLGWHKAGKTSVINTILGSSVAVAVSGQCVKKEGYVRGRRVTLVDTPGWWKSCSIRDSPELSKQAIMRSVSMCPPGPQVFLLVIETDVSFKEKYMEPLVQRLELLSERVWRYTIVLFTGGDSLTRTIEQHIQNDGETLQRLLKKCGNRYHVIDNINKDDGSQVEELFGKIENVVRQNDGRSFEVDVKVLQELQGKWEEVQSRASAWQSRVLEERSLIKDKELRMVLLGWVMSGKSSAGNTILNREEFVTRERTTKCRRRSGDVAGRKITVLDTPGYWKFFSPEFNPEWVKAEVFKGVSQFKKFPHAMLLVLPADTSFTDEQKKIIIENMAIFGEQIWRHTIVLFTWGDFLGNASVEQHIDSEGDALQWLIKKCGNRYHVFENTKRGDNAQVIELLEKIEEMVAGNGLFRPGVTELRENTMEQLLYTSEDVQVGDILKPLKEEWNRRTKEFRENLEKLLSKAIKPSTESSRSITPPPIFGKEKESIQTSETSGSESEVDSAQKFGIKEQLLSLLEREWSRQEAMVMDNVHEILLKPSQVREASSEVGEDKIEESVAKVEWWLSDCKDEKHTCSDDEILDDSSTAVC